MNGLCCVFMIKVLRIWTAKLITLYHAPCNEEGFVPGEFLMTLRCIDVVTKTLMKTTPPLPLFRFQEKVGQVLSRHMSRALTFTPTEVLPGIQKLMDYWKLHRFFIPLVLRQLPGIKYCSTCQEKFAILHVAAVDLDKPTGICDHCDHCQRCLGRFCDSISPTRYFSSPQHHKNNRRRCSAYVTRSRPRKRRCI